MGLTVADSGGGDFKLPPEGNHLAVCFALIDMGMQESSYNGETKVQHKIRVGWELHTDERLEDGRLFSVWKNYTASLHEKATLRQDLERWRGRSFTAEELEGFDLKAVVGVPCLVQVTHKTVEGGKTYANVTGVSSLPRGMPKPERENDLQVYDPDDPKYADASILPEWLQEKLGAQPAKSPEQAYESMPEMTADEEFEDVPF